MLITFFEDKAIFGIFSEFSVQFGARGGVLILMLDVEFLMLDWSYLRSIIHETCLKILRGISSNIKNSRSSINKYVYFCTQIQKSWKKLELLAAEILVYHW